MNSTVDSTRRLLPRRPRVGSWSETRVALITFVMLAALPIFVDGYAIYILPQYMIYGLLAMSLGLLWGFTGIVSFGQAAFFTIGGYAMGLCMGLGLPFNAGYLGLLAACALSGTLAGLAGYFLFSAGVRSTHFVLITLALAIITEQIAVSQSWLTGGYNGMFIPRMPLGLDSAGDIPGNTAMYFFVLALSAGCYFIMRWILLGRFGKILTGIRENEDRLTAFGYRIDVYKSAAFAISGVLAGFAGALYATTSGFVSPSLAGVLFSTMVVVWVAIGGRHSLLGAFTGAVLVASVSSYMSAIIPNYWQLIVGVGFILVIVFFKRGLAGLAESAFVRLKGGDSS